MRTSRLTVGLCVATVAILAGAATQATAASINPSEYALTEIVGTYSHGLIDFNMDIPVDNVAELPLVEAMMSDGPQPEAIYNWPTDDVHALVFAMNAGQDYTLNALTFSSSRSYNDLTPIQVEYGLDGGAWTVAAQTTPGALGVTTGALVDYTIALGDVQADRVRFVTDGGGQLSLHEIVLEGTIYNPGGPGGVIPEPLTVVAVLGAMGGLGGYLRKRRAA